MSGEAQIVVEGVCHSYRPPVGRAVLALEDVSLEVRPQEFARADVERDILQRGDGPAVRRPVGMAHLVDDDLRLAAHAGAAFPRTLNCKEP